MEPTKRKSFRKIAIPGDPFSFSQSLVNYYQEWRVEGHLHNPTQAQREAIQNLQNDEVMLVDIDAFSLFGYGKVRDVRLAVDNEYPNVYRYSLTVAGCPAIGFTHVHTDDVYLHDLDYRKNLKAFDPHFQKFNVSYDTTRFTITCEFYLDNDAASLKHPLIEIQCGDNINKFFLYHYNGSAWIPIGTWGTGAMAWGTYTNFYDAGTVAHQATVNYGARGSVLTVAGGGTLGTLSLKLGCKYRILCKISDLSAHSGTDLTTDYSADQLLLRVALEHSAAESGYRDYVKMTYVDGSLDYGPA